MEDVLPIGEVEFPKAVVPPGNPALPGYFAHQFPMAFGRGYGEIPCEEVLFVFVVEADSPEQAKLKADHEDTVYSESQVDSVEEVEDFYVYLR